MYHSGDEVEFSCESGYELSNSSWSSNECVDGEWNHQLPKCVGS